MGATNAIALLALLLQYGEKVAQITGLLNTAAKEGRDVTDAELDALMGDDDAARARLQAAIDAAKAAQPGS